MTVIIDGSASADFATPLPLTEGGTGTALATTAIVQRVNTQTGAVATSTTAIPFDDTIPQNTEGGEFMTLAITPTSATSKLRIDVVFIGATSATATLACALFQDTTADAIAVAMGLPSGNWSTTMGFSHTMTAGTTSATTFKLRAGSTSGTLTFNGTSAARKFGGVLASSITITEYTA
jgi:hypothetical protein